MRSDNLTPNAGIGQLFVKGFAPDQRRKGELVPERFDECLCVKGRRRESDLFEKRGGEKIGDFPRLNVLGGKRAERDTRFGITGGIGSAHAEGDSRSAERG